MFSSPWKDPWSVLDFSICSKKVVSSPFEKSNERTQAEGVILPKYPWRILTKIPDTWTAPSHHHKNFQMPRDPLCVFFLNLKKIAASSKNLTALHVPQVQAKEWTWKTNKIRQDSLPFSVEMSWRRLKIDRCFSCLTDEMNSTEICYDQLRAASKLLFGPKLSAPAKSATKPLLARLK